MCMCVCVSESVSICHMHPVFVEAKERALEPLKLELQAELEPWKNSKGLLVTELSLQPQFCFCFNKVFKKLLWKPLSPLVLETDSGPGIC